MKMLSLDDQPGLVSFPPETEVYFFMPAIGIQEQTGKWYQDKHEMTSEDKESCIAAYQSCADNMDNFIQNGEAENKRLFIKEHVQLIVKPVVLPATTGTNGAKKRWPWTVSISGTSKRALQSPLNETVFPDEFLLSWTPTFLIRHPALAFESYYRNWLGIQKDMGGDMDAQIPMMEIFASFQPNRDLYDFYKQHYEAHDDKVWPIVIDAHDVVHNPEVLHKYCQMTGLVSSKLKSEWDAYEVPDQGGFIGTAAKWMLSSIAGSKGIMKDKARPNIDIDIDIEATVWREKFGDDAGAMIERWVRNAMPDYEYMKSKRLRPDATNPAGSA